jgi:hypothetical protein
MKSTCIITFLLALLSFEAISQKRTLNDLEKNKIRGRVNLIEQETFKVKEHFGEIIKVALEEKGNTWYNEKGYITKNSGFNNFRLLLDLDSLFNYTYQYDRLNNLTEHNSYKSDGSLDSKDIYKYDNNNLTEHNSYKSDGSLDSKNIYKYDDKGNQVEINYYKADGALFGKSLRQFDAMGNKKEENNYNPNGEWIKKIIYNYNEMGNLIEEDETQEYNKGELRFTSKYSYDKKNNLIDEKSYINGELNNSCSSTYKYDEKGNITEERSFTLDDAAYTNTYVYKFDEKGNWIVSTVFRGFAPIQITERRIIYYPN